MSKRYWTIGSLIEMKRPSWDTEKTMVVDRINTYIVVSFENPYPYTQWTLFDIKKLTYEIMDCRILNQYEDENELVVLHTPGFDY